LDGVPVPKCESEPTKRIARTPRRFLWRQLVNHYALRVVILLAGLALTTPHLAFGGDPFELRDGDRIVLIGDDLIERNQKRGYLETQLIIRNPDKSLVFRNLGWSADTVFGDSRAGFGTRADGFQQLKSHVLGLKPSVILVGYGMSDSFAGEPGLLAFEKGLGILLDTLEESKATFVFLGPIEHESLGSPLPNPRGHNRSLELYRDVLARAAQARKSPFIDLSQLAPAGAEIALVTPAREEAPLTSNGIHLNAKGYWVVDTRIANTLSHEDDWKCSVRLDGDELVASNGVEVSGLRSIPDGIRFEARLRRLPDPSAPKDAAGEATGDGQGIMLEYKGLKQGRYTLRIDGKPVRTASADEWGRWRLTNGPDHSQTEAVRTLVNEKNRLYFYRWRPQNETYLFGFRKHEQGNNAREIPLFDPLVEAKEKEIARLRVPVSHVYELIRESEVGQ